MNITLPTWRNKSFFFGLKRNLENVCIPSHLFVSDAHATPPLLVACEKLCSLMERLARSASIIVKVTVQITTVSQCSDFFPFDFEAFSQRLRFKTSPRMLQN